MAGRKPTPTQTKIIQGTFRNDRAVNEPTPAPLSQKEYQPPRWLKGRVARKAWRRFYQVLTDNNVLTEMDRTALEMLCIAYAKWREAAEKAKVGLYETKTGYVSHNPLINVENRYAKELRALLTEFGLTPSSRSRIDLPMPKEAGQDPMEKILNEA
jgi:P27 family predicted phage terminase small subunit